MHWQKSGATSRKSLFLAVHANTTDGSLIITDVKHVIFTKKNTVMEKCIVDLESAFKKAPPVVFVQGAHADIRCQGSLTSPHRDERLVKWGNGPFTRRMQLLVYFFLHFGGISGTRSWNKYVYEESTFTSHTGSSAGNDRNSKQDAGEGFESVARKDYYSVLEIPTSAKKEEIRKAYMKLALEYHPDRHSNKSEEEKKKMSSKFRKVKEAYDTLIDPKERRKYDKRNSEKPSSLDTNIDDFLKEKMTRPQFCSNVFKFDTDNSMNSEFDTENLESFRRYFASSFPNKKEKRTVDIEVPATLDELFSGMRFTCKIWRKVSDTTEDKVMEFNIKPGYKAGTSITFHEYGNQLSDGTFQDVRLVLAEKPHPMFTRVGNDLEMNVEIGLEELIRGFQKTIELPGNRTYTLTHREFEMIGECITIPSLGMPLHRYPSKRGDLRIKSTMVVPQLTRAQRRRILMDLAPLDDEE